MSLIRSLLANQFQDNPSSTMDVMGNYFGTTPATQEANVKPQTTTIDYNQDGSVDVSQKKTIDQNGQEQQIEINRSLPPQQVQAMEYQVPQLEQPVSPQQNAQASQQVLEAQMRDQMMRQRAQVPQMAQPVAPQQVPVPQVQQPQMAQPQAPQQPVAPQNPVFNRMVQAESGGQQYNPQGGVLTSPKGAQGIAQIMPATAAQPGYGIAPATPQEIATKEGNLAFGQRYHQGMLQQFGGDQEKAVAAYNAGPGRVQQAVAQAEKEGGTWKDYLPAETKTYLTDVFPKNQELAKRVQPMIAGMASSDVGLTPTEQAIHQIALNSGDINAIGMGAYTGGNAIDPAARRAYADQHATLLEQQKAEAKAQKDLQTYLTDPTGRGGLKLANDLKKEGEEGSYLKAYLFKRLGLNDLAKQEQQKLGAGDTWAQTMVNGAPAWVKYNGSGAPVKGYNAEGELSGKDLIAAQQAKGVTTHTGKMQDVVSGKIYYEQTTPFGVQLVDNQGNKYTGDSANLRAYGIGSDIATKNLLQLQTLRNDLLNKPKIKAAEYLGEYNAKNGTNYTMDQVINAQPPMMGGAQAPVQQAPQAAVPGAPAISQAAQNAVVSPQGQPVAPQQAQPQQQMPAPQGPAVPGQQLNPPGVQPSPTPGVPGTKALRPPMPGESPAQYEAYKKVYDAEQQKASEKIADMKIGLPNAEATADSILKTVTDVVNHPGFSDVVGVPNVLTGIYSPPGTDARNFKAKYKQLQGQEFLTAFNQLKGGGAISDIEGRAATDAIAALNDPNISEAEFKRNASILEDTVKRGINRQRQMIGEEPSVKYMLGTQSDEQKKAAYDWSKANPTDPRAAEIRKRLGL